MKKKIIICLITVLLVVAACIILINMNHKKDNERYEQIKKDVREEAITYLTIIQTPYAEGYEYYLYEDDIVNPLHRGADKNILLDVDNKSYCKSSIRGFVKDGKWDADVYLKCNKYEDKEYEDALLVVLCTRSVPEGYEEYYEKYGKEYDNLVCPERIEKIIEKNRSLVN